MTTYVTEKSITLTSGIGKMKSAMIEDFKLFMEPEGEIRTKMNEEYAYSFEIKHGSKYIKILSNRSATAFIVATDNDKKFKKGDILKPAGWAAPARNAARGNILDGNYPINWTGPLYL